MHTFSVLFLGSGAILECECYRNFTFGIANIFHIPNECGARHRRVLVFVRQHRRYLTTTQLDAIFTQIVFGPGTRIQTGVRTFVGV